MRFMSRALAIVVALSLAACRGPRRSAGRRGGRRAADHLLRLPGPGDGVLDGRPQGHHRDPGAPQGHTVIEQNSNEDANKQLEQVKNCIAQGVDGIIVIPVDGSIALKLIAEANAANIPIGIFNRPPQSDEGNALMVVADNETIADAGRRAHGRRGARSWARR